MFIQMDANNDGVLSKDEVRKEVENMFSGEDLDNWEKIIDSIITSSSSLKFLDQKTT